MSNNSQQDMIDNLKKKGVKIIGFDLDSTLYPFNDDINNAIQEYIYTRAAQILKISIEETRKMWMKAYAEKGSGGKALRAMGVENGSDLVQEALENTDFTKFLVPDEKTTKMLVDLRDNGFVIDLITGSNLELAKRKLGYLKIPETIFNHIIGGDKLSKSDGMAFAEWTSRYGNIPNDKFVYVGDRTSTDIKPLELPFLKGITGVLLDPKGDSQFDCIRIKLITDLNQILLG